PRGPRHPRRLARPSRPASRRPPPATPAGPPCVVPAQPARQAALRASPHQGHSHLHRRHRLPCMENHPPLRRARRNQTVAPPPPHPRRAVPLPRPQAQRRYSLIFFREVFFQKVLFRGGSRARRRTNNHFPPHPLTFRASFEQGGTPCVRQVRPQNDLAPRSDSIRSEKALGSVLNQGLDEFVIYDSLPTSGGGSWRMN